MHMCVCMCAQSCLRVCDPPDCSPPGSSVHGILQAKTLGWVAISSSRDLPHPWIKPASLVSPALADGFFTTSGKPIFIHIFFKKEKNPKGTLADIARSGRAQSYENGKLFCLHAYLSPKACALAVPFLLRVAWKTHASMPKSNVTHWAMPSRLPRWKACIPHKAASQIQTASTAPQTAALSLLACKLLLLDCNFLQNTERVLFDLHCLSGH